MKIDDIKKSISQNDEKIESKKQKIKDIQAEIKQLEEKNANLEKELIIENVRQADVASDDIANLLSIAKYVIDQGIDISDIKKTLPASALAGAAIEEESKK